VTRVTRPKKPSSSRGFAHEAAQPTELRELGDFRDLGDLKPKTEIFFLSFQAGNNYQKEQKNKNTNFFNIFFYRLRPRG
jgi:hypothetical protein